MRSLYIVFTCCILGFASCNGGSNTTTDGTDSTKTTVSAQKLQPQSKLNEGGTAALMAVVSKYYDLKNALVATKASDADHAADQLKTMADSMLAFLQTDSVNKVLLQPFLDTIIMQSKAVTAVMDETCEKKRLAFGTISSAIYGLAKKTELKNAGIDHEYCPMAFNEKGASWLSAESEIKNPYFGKKMMECGEVTDSL